MELKRSQLSSFVIFVFSIALAVNDVHGYGYGAPNDRSSCNTLLPTHYTNAQTTEIPYDVIVDDTPNNGIYVANENHTVTISGKSGTTFRGFLLQARRYTSSDVFTVFGSFVTSSDAQNTCAVVGGASVTHKTNNDKQSVQVVWIAPPNATGTVEFRGTIVETEFVFWEFAPTVSSPPTSPPNTTAEPPVAINTTECGKTKGCFFSNCDDPNDSNQCEYGLTWSEAGPGETAFELFASATFSATPYVAFGLSKDTKMGDDSVTECIYSQSTATVNIQMSWNAGLENFVLNNKTMSLVNGSTSGSFSNGMLLCRFARLTYPPPPTDTRTKRQTNLDQVLYPGADVYYISIAKGPTSSGMKAQHTFEPVVSADKVNFTQFVSSSGIQGLSPLIKAHGILMIFAWMVFASFGMLIPRYYKTAWPGKKWGGKPIWFQLHQPLMVITFILTAVGFILIFVEEKGYSQLESPAVAHAPLGIIVMALVLINPIMAAFRPDPSSDKRWLFNVLHFLVGLLSHLSAAVALFLATYIEKLGFPDWCRWVMVGYICWHASIEIILAVDMHMTLRKKAKATKKDEIAMQSAQDSKHEDHKSTSEAYSLFRTTFGVLHLVGVLGCSIALSVQIGIS